MDLTDIWQEHKKFILAVAGALVLLLVGQGIIKSTYPVAAVASESNRVSSRLRRDPEVTSSIVRSVQAEVDELRERLTSLVAEMNFRTEELFELPAGVSPTSYCWETIREMQRILVDEAERQDIRVPEKLGLEDAAPTDPEEVRRTLRALNIIYNVVLTAIDSNVKRIQRIRIEEASRSRVRGASFVTGLSVEFEIVGTEVSVRTLIDTLVTDGRSGKSTFLELSTPTSIVPHKQERGMMVLRMTVTGLELAVEDLDLETS